MRQVQNNPQMASNKALNQVSIWPFCDKAGPLGEICGHLKREMNSRLLTAVKIGLAVYSRAMISFWQDMPPGCTLGKNKHTADQKEQ